MALSGHILSFFLPLKYVHEILVNHLGGLSLPRKSAVRLTDLPDMTAAVYRGRKTTQQDSDGMAYVIDPSVWSGSALLAHIYLFQYSRTSMARTLMACLPQLFRTRSIVPRKNPLAADLGFFVYSTANVKFRFVSGLGDNLSR